MAERATEILERLRSKRLELKGRIERAGLSDKQISEMTGGRIAPAQVWHLRSKCIGSAEMCDAVEEALEREGA